MENVVGKQFGKFYRDRSVFITGHTGFKGGWLATWLKMLGTRVTGFALPPESSKPNLFEIASIGEGMVSIFGDVRDCSALTAAFEAQRPDIAFHLAAQPLVRRSYVDPVETYATNVMGTVHFLQAVKSTPSVRVAIIITSDKCYDNCRAKAYSESDAMGGHDPYSASKGAAELVTASYRKSFFPPDHVDRHGVSLSSVRAGNVIGGGDWSKDRLIPDCILSLKSGQPIVVRNPQMIRPWQHVLEPIAGYLWLAIRMREDPVGYAGAWNFGPCADESKTVRDVVNQVVAHWGSGQWELPLEGCQAPHEDMSLRLDSTKAANLLGWETVLSVRESVQKAVKWYRAYYQDPNFNGYDVTTHNIADYVRTAQQAGIRWAM